MPSDVTILRFDLDEATVRRVLSAIPGVTPLPPEDESETDADGDRAPARGADAASPSSGASPERTDHPGTASEPRPDPARAGWSPWPGAPSAGDEEDQGWSRRRKALVGAGLVLGLGLIAVALYVLVRRFRGDSDGDGGARNGGGGPDEPGGLPSFGDLTGESEDDEDAEADADDARSPPIEVSPVVGMAFLVAVAGVVRRFRAGADDESDAGDESPAT